MKLVTKLWCVILLCGLATHAMAQSNVSANILDTIEQINIEQQDRLAPSFDASPSLFTGGMDTSPQKIDDDSNEDIKQANETASESPCFVIDHIQLQDSITKETQGVSASSNITLSDALLKKYQGQCMDIAAIKNLLREANNHLIAQGYVTSRIAAYPQNLSSGILNLTLHEGKIEEITTLPDRQVITAFPNQENQILHLRDLEQAMENLDAPYCLLIKSITPSLILKNLMIHPISKPP